MSALPRCSFTASSSKQPRLLPKEPGQNYSSAAGSTDGQKTTFPQTAGLGGRVLGSTVGADPPTKKRRDPERNKKNQRDYRQRRLAGLGGMEEVRAENRQRYHKRIDRLKAEGAYQAYVNKKTQDGLRRYHTMSEEERAALRLKNNQFQKAWRERMRQDGTYAEYRRQLNARRRQQVAEKKKAMGPEKWKAEQKRRYTMRVNKQYMDRWEWLNGNGRPFPLPWKPLDWLDDAPPEDEDKVQSIRNGALEKMDQYL